MSSAFPMKEDEPRVDEDKLQGVKELGDLDPGKSGELHLDRDRSERRGTHGPCWMIGS